MPVIAFAARIPNGHMIGTIVAFVYGYGGMFASGNAALAVSAVFIVSAKENVPVNKAKKHKETIVKKGW